MAGVQALIPPPPSMSRGGDDYAVEVTVVMPCLDESRTVGVCVAKARRSLERIRGQHEIIVADNGSTDGSPEIAAAAGARVLNVSDRGYGAALRAGIGAARGRFVIMGDADDSYDFDRIEGFVERLQLGDDLVIGNRFRGGIMPGAMPALHRYIGNPALTGLLNLFFRSPIGDTQCGLRAFRRDAYERLGLISIGMEFASEMVVKACMLGLQLSELPVILHPDGRGRRPHLRPFRDGWRHLRLMLLLCPTWLFLAPAAIMMLAGLSLMIWLTPSWRKVGGVGLDVHTMMLGSLCVLLAHQLAWMWAHAKILGWTTGALPSDAITRWIVKRFTLERGILVGVGLITAGLAANCWLIAEWRDRGLGALEVRTTLRYALWGMTSLILGGQVLSSSFLLSIQLLGSSGPGGPPIPKGDES